MQRVLDILGLAGMVIAGAVFYLACLVAIAVVVSLPLSWSYERKRRRRLRALREQNLLTPWPRLKARMTRLARPTLLLVPTREPVFSKMGGDPELPGGVDWPMGVKGPRAFVGQLNLEEVHLQAGLPWLPGRGCLSFFYDDERHGFADVVQVIYSDGAALETRTPPTGLSKRQRFSERRVCFLAFTSYPSLDWLDVDYTHLEEDVLERAEAFDGDPFGDEIQHRIGGYPSQIQSGQLAVECESMRRGEPPDYTKGFSASVRRASRQWRLLLQVDTDEPLGMTWGDSGRLYVFVREQDARAGNFSRTVTITQSH